MSIDTTIDGEGQRPDCDPVLFIARRAQDLCDLARGMGVVLEISLEPRTPLAMRNYEMKVSTRAVRDNKESS
jgi:hypothetical protein